MEGGYQSLDVDVDGEGIVFWRRVAAGSAECVAFFEKAWDISEGVLEALDVIFGLGGSSLPGNGFPFEL